MSLKTKIADLIRMPLEEEGFDLIELKVSQYRKNGNVRVFVGSDNGIKLDDCAHLSRIIGATLDENGIFKDGYALEVSSPGLDRPLQTEKDFRRGVGEIVRIFFDDAASTPIQGELMSADNGQIELQTEDGPKNFDLAGVKMGKIIL